MTAKCSGPRDSLAYPWDIKPNPTIKRKGSAAQTRHLATIESVTFVIKDSPFFINFLPRGANAFLQESHLTPFSPNMAIYFLEGATPVFIPKILAQFLWQRQPVEHRSVGRDGEYDLVVGAHIHGHIGQGRPIG